MCSIFCPIPVPLPPPLAHFCQSRNIPHLLFVGASGSGKSAIIRTCLHTLYGVVLSAALPATHVKMVNCRHEKGIQFVRDQLKFFAKTQVLPWCVPPADTDAAAPSIATVSFKCLVLLNSDHLTVDAQSALRRCIELYSHTTRFILHAEDKDKLLKPILSRLCEVYLPLPAPDGLSYYVQNARKAFPLADWEQQRRDAQKAEWNAWRIGSGGSGGDHAGTTTPTPTPTAQIDWVERWTARGWTALDLVELLEADASGSVSAHQLCKCRHVLVEMRHEKTALLCVLALLG